jgi:hypothetical protein
MAGHVLLRRRGRTLLFTSGFLGALATAASAQIIRGTVTDERTGAPLRGTVVTLLASDGRPTDARALTSESGAFALRARAPGTFTVELRAIGFVRARRSELTVGAGETRVLDIVMQRVLTRLAGVRIPSRSARLGLSFRPQGNRSPNDVDGILWIDASSRELQTLEFTYTGLADAQRLHLGGRVSFTRLENGLWVDDRWVIRAPLLRRLVSGEQRFRGLRLQGETRDSVLALREEGGFVVTDSTRARLFSRIDGRITRRGAEPLPATRVRGALDSHHSLRLCSFVKARGRSCAFDSPR